MSTPAPPHPTPSTQEQGWLSIQMYPLEAAWWWHTSHWPWQAVGQDGGHFFLLIITHLRPYHLEKPDALHVLPASCVQRQWLVHLWHSIQDAHMEFSLHVAGQEAQPWLEWRANSLCSGRANGSLWWFFFCCVVSAVWPWTWLFMLWPFKSHQPCLLPFVPCWPASKPDVVGFSPCSCLDWSYLQCSVLVG